jgi:hypothetical protein
MVIKERTDTTGTLRCPDCGHFIYLVCESFESLTDKQKKKRNKTDHKRIKKEMKTIFTKCNGFKGKKSVEGNS